MEGKELTWGQRGRLWLRLGIRLVGAVIAVALVVTVLPPLLSLFMPFVLALVVAWLLNPLVRLLHQRLGVSRKITFMPRRPFFRGGSGGTKPALPPGTPLNSATGPGWPTDSLW